MLSIFPCDCWPPEFLLGKTSVQFFCPLFNQAVFFGFLFCFVLFFLMLSCMKCLYILGFNPLSVISFANIFSHSVGCLFILSVVSFLLQELLRLIRSHLFMFAFVSLALGDRSEKNIGAVYVKNVL